ncbi:hypothetical protein B0H13DRAFT_2313108 [Mycena leptocephala]|nr:hypothetical protein B0H13DRAFT_2313108 [Mycena leptocephala]
MRIVVAMHTSVRNHATVTELEAPADQSVVEPEGLGFPAAWLAPITGKYRTDFSVEWNRFYGTNFLSVEIAGLIIRLYFDIPGCIILIAYIPECPQETFVFTIAGVERKKDFYIFNYDSPVSANELHLLRPVFSSVADFHLNRGSDQLVPVAPRPDKKAETLEALIKCGFEKDLKRTVYEFGESSDSDE